MSSSASNITIDEARAPLYTIELLSTQDESDTQKNIEFYRRRLIQKQPFAIVMKVSGGRHALQSPSTKRIQSFFKDNKDALGDLCLGIAYVLDSLVLRMAMRSIKIAFKFNFPTAVYSNVEEAEAWCVEKLQAADLEPARS